MFSPPTKKSSFSARKNVAIRRDDYSSPLAGNRSPLLDSPAVPNRPATGTPAPWTSRLSVRARITPTKRNDRGDDVDAVQPVYVGEFPQEVRDAQFVSSQNHVPADASIVGGMDKETSLAWIICANRLFIWNYLLPAASRKCTVIDLTSATSEIGDVSSWLIRVVNWDTSKKIVNNAVQQSNSAGIILCNKYTGALIFWPDIYNANNISPLACRSFSDKLGSSNAPKSCYINSLIASSVPGAPNSCIALACSSKGLLWRFHCSPAGIHCKQTEHIFSQENDAVGKGYPRSFIWNPFGHSSDKTTKQFLLLTDDEIQCFAVNLSSEYHVSKLWSQKIVGPDGDLGIQKGLAGQKKIWPLDLDVDSDGKVMTILIAIFCKDRGTSSSYTEYSLLTMQYKSGVDKANPMGEQILEKKAPIQVIIPKARVENEDFLFSMGLKVGGKPAGSAVILSGDGTATVSHYWRNSTKLYQFDLPNDAGKVLDASVFPSLDESKDGAWVVLTEKAGVWAIPERAVLLGGVEPPERSLSRKGSSNDGFLGEERRSFSVSGNIAPRRVGSEAWDAGDGKRAGLSGAARRIPQDEESETLLSQLFHDFLLSGQVDGALDKLKNTRAFERDGEVNVFARTSKSIVDTLAKHWTTTRGSEIALSVVSTQLAEKQQKHQKFLQFLALSKCHEELCSRQRQSMQIIMEHGEKLASMIELRELQNTITASPQLAVAATTRRYSPSLQRCSISLSDKYNQMADNPQVDDGSVSHQNEETLEEMLSRHRKETSDLQNKEISMKKAAAKGSKAEQKAKKKQVDEEIHKLSTSLKEKQNDQLTSFGYTTSTGEQKGNMDILVKAIAGVSVSNQPEQSKPSKSVKRRGKRAQQEAAREQRIQEEQSQVVSDRLVEDEKLEKKLLPLGFMINEIKPDGHCLYRAIEDQLGLQSGGLSPYTYQQLREMAAAYMRDHALDFLPFFLSENVASGGTEESITEIFESYCREIESTAAWGGQLELGALTHCLKKHIKVFSGSFPDVEMGKEYKRGEIGSSVLLSYHRHAFGLGEHYNSVVPVVYM